MRALRGHPIASPLNVLPVQPDPPSWVRELLAGSRAIQQDDVTGDGRIPHHVRSCTHGDFTLLSTSVREPAHASAQDLADVSAAVYRSLGREIERQQCHAIRIWNFVPDIQGAIGGAGDRYMAFNMGRFAAYCDWFGGPEAFRATLPTSSAVGVTGHDLWVHVLAAGAPGVPVENPRQVPSYRYSRRYGVRPPCFARATKSGGQLFIGGTASILGEQSRHERDIEAQSRETFQNLAALIEAADPSARRPLDLLQSLRVHVRHAHDAPAVQVILEELTPHVAEIELVQTPLCRKELLVEIEGVAEC